MPGGVKVGVGYVDIRPDLTGFGRELQTGMNRNVRNAGDDAAKTLKGSFASAAKGAAAAFGAAFAAVKVTDFIGSSIQAASDLQESLSKSGVVFGTFATQLDNWAKGAAEAFGLSRQEATEAAATFGNMFDAMGLSQSVSMDMSKSIVELAADLASFNNIDISDAIERLRSGLLGEQEAVERLGINMSETRLKAKALEMGMGDGKKVLDATSKAQAAYAIILEDTTNAQGDFARTASNLANQQRIMNAQWSDAKADLGEGLLPIMTDLAGVINNSLIPAFKTLFLSSGADATGWAATLRDVIGDTVGFALGAFAELARGVANLIGAIPGNVGEGVVQNLRDTADAADDARVRLHASTGELLLWNSAAEDGEHATSRFALAVRGVLPELEGMAGATKESASALRESNKTTRDAASAERDFEEATRDYNKLLKQGAVDEEKVADARERLDDATRSLNKANRDLADAQEDYNDAQNAYLALPTDTNADKLRDASNGLADAKDNVADASARQKQAEAELAKEKAGDPDYQDKLADAKDRVADAEDKIAKASDAIAVASKKAADSQKALNTELGYTQDQLTDLLTLVRSIDQPVPGLPTPGVPSVPTFSIPSAAPGSLGPTVPNVTYQPVTPAPTTTNNITVNVTEPVQDPGLIGKAIAWVL
jgi:hypothetical protein